jgi:putative chitinase
VPDFEADPESLCLRPWAALSAADFWDEHDLNTWADAEDFDGVSDVINRGRKTQALGDSNGFAQRLALYNAAKKALA